MDILSGLSLAAKVLHALGESASDYEARERAIAYVVDKYDLSPVQSVTHGIVSQYGTGETVYVCDDTWERALIGLLQLILRSSQPTKEVMVACGDLAMFILILDGKLRRRMTDDEWRANSSIWRSKNKRPEWPVYGVRNSETFKSLLEMGRGRGSDLALELIQQELREWLRDHELNSIRAAVDTLKQP